MFKNKQFFDTKTFVIGNKKLKKKLKTKTRKQNFF